MSNASVEIIFETTAHMTSKDIDEKIDSHNYSDDSILSGVLFNGRISIMHP